jgi:flagellar hook-length control protein FliK
MALQSSTPSHAAAPHSAASAIASAHGARNATKMRTSADEQDDGGFAAQLMRAQPDQDAKPADADAKADAPKATAKDDDDKDGKDTKAAKTPDGTPPAVDPNALLPWAPPVAPATTSLATRADGDDGADAAGGLLGGLRRGKGKGDKDIGLAALGLGKDAGKDAKAADATALSGKGGKSAADFTAALGKGEGAGNGATGTRDAMAALLPQADPVSVQAGSIGASPNSLLDNNAANQAAPTPPAQATLPMTPQSPTFAPALGQQIAVWMKDGVQHAEVQLSPADLGPIRVKIEMAGAQARVEMAADVQSTRDALQQAMPQLADSLGQVGLSLSGGGVSDQSTAQQQAQSQAFATAAGGSGGHGGRPGHGATRGAAGDAGGEDFAVATASRQAAQRRGLLDMYA